VDFIERFFGVAPDGGNGALELIFFSGVLITIGLIIIVRRTKSKIVRPFLSDS
jgi:hypothetical protein